MSDRNDFESKISSEATMQYEDEYSQTLDYLPDRNIFLFYIGFIYLLFDLVGLMACYTILIDYETAYDISKYNSTLNGFVYSFILFIFIYFIYQRSIFL